MRILLVEDEKRMAQALPEWHRPSAIRSKE